MNIFSNFYSEIWLYIHMHVSIKPTNAALSEINDDQKRLYLMNMLYEIPNSMRSEQHKTVCYHVIE